MPVVGARGRECGRNEFHFSKGCVNSFSEFISEQRLE